MKIRTIGFKSGKLDSTASGLKLRRGMVIEEIDKEELLDL